MKQYLLIFSLLLSASFLTAQHWTVTELNSMPESISNNAVCEGFVNGVPYVYTFAGIDSTKEYSGIHNRSYRYNTQTDIWESIDPLPDPMGGKIATSANRVGDIIYIIGGYYVMANGSEVSSDKVHRYDTQNNSFLADGAPIPVPIDDQVQVVYKDSLIYVISGWSNSGNVNDVQIYDPAIDQWQVGMPITFNEVAVFGAAGTILGDTIYFFGGARNGSFSIQSKFRKGAINPNDPTEITWSAGTLSSSLKAYRPAATTADNTVYFLGGSDQTYNFDGLAYSNGQGVDPNNRSMAFRPSDGYFEEDLSNDLPMDLRGIANESDVVKYLAGGMLPDQMVTNKLWKLEWQGNLPTAVNEPLLDQFALELFPNPASEYLQIKLPQNWNGEVLQVQIFDQSGKIILHQNKVNLQEAINIQSFPTGSYELKVINGKKALTAQFIKI